MQEFSTKCAAARQFGIVLLLSAAIAACDPATQTDSKAVSADSTDTPDCGPSGFLKADMYGALSGSLDWSTGDLHCAGMPRPGGAGARLRFAGVANDGGQAIAIILALPQLAKDATGREFASNVTLIEEGSGRFFSTINTDNCLTDIVSLTAIDGSDDRYSIQGKTYCISPLAEVNGTSSVSLPELHFTGLIDWSSS